MSNERKYYFCTIKKLKQQEKNEVLEDFTISFCTKPVCQHISTDATRSKNSKNDDLHHQRLGGRYSRKSYSLPYGIDKER